MKLPKLEKLESLFSLRRIDTISADTLRSTDSSLIVGKKRDRRCLDWAITNIDRRLSYLKSQHKILDDKLIKDRNFLSLVETKQLKMAKLNFKDEIMKLTIVKNASAADTSTKVPSSTGDSLLLGSGSFAKVLHGTNIITQQTVAIKTSNLESFNDLWKEYLVLERLKNDFGFPHSYYFGKQNILQYGPMAVLVMDLLGPSIESLLFSTTLGTSGFSSLTVLRIAHDLVNRLQSLQRHNIVHNDIHPGNILMGNCGASNNTCFLVDFGRATLSLPSQDHANVDMQKMFRGALKSSIDATVPLQGRYNATGTGTGTGTTSIAGSVRRSYGTIGFSSANSLLGTKLTTLDDLESVVYTLSYL